MKPDVGRGQRIKRSLRRIKLGVFIWLLALFGNLLVRRAFEESDASAFGGWITLMICLVGIRIFSARVLRDHEAPSAGAGLRLGLQFLAIVAGLDALFLGWASKEGPRYLASGQPVLGLLYLESVLVPAVSGIVEARRRAEEGEV